MDRASVRSAIIVLGALAVFIGLLWLTEALPLAVVSLMVSLRAWSKLS